jgi:hypothetical protein
VPVQELVTEIVRLINETDLAQSLRGDRKWVVQ